MVIIGGGKSGGNILESGDPDYAAITGAGPKSPQNDVLDPVSTTPLSVTILTQFGIPFDATFTNQGTPLPGFDIHNQDVTTMLKLSLLTELINGKFIEIEMDENGIARFYEVGTEAASNVDIRYCVPTSDLNQPIDLVIVRGYDTPPERQLRDSFDGLKNKELMGYEDCAKDSCEEGFVARHATISYDDPQLDQTYLDDIKNSYELKAFESLMGYLIDLDLPDGIENVPGLKITFGDTTKEYIEVDTQFINNTINVNSFLGNKTGRAGVSGFSTISDTGSGTFRTGGSVPIIVNLINEGNFNGLPVCGVDLTSIAGGVITFPRERFLRENKFGELESDFMGVVDIVFSAHKVRSFTLSPGGFGINGSLVWVVSPLRDLVSLQHGKNWSWTIDVSEDVSVYLFSILEDARAQATCDVYSNPAPFFSDPASATKAFSFSNDLLTSTPVSETEFICNIGDDLGYYNPGGKMCVVVERRRPSIDIFDPRGAALSLASQISVTYTPLVVVDLPQPITYAAPDALTNATKTIDAFGIIDQADGIIDADPTTKQNLSDSETSVLQDNTDGFTLDLTLPFCEEDDCLTIAKELLALQSAVTETKSVIMGPSSEPKLGQVLADGTTINEISYSYSDSSQYLITVAAGPKYQNLGSFSNSAYQLQTTDVTRDGLVIQDAGNGAEYVVRVNGFGEITALSMVLEDISVGDRVNVRIYNVPQERIK